MKPSEVEQTAPLAQVSVEGVKWHFGASARLRRDIVRGPYCGTCGALLDAVSIRCPHPQLPPGEESQSKSSKTKPMTDYDFIPGNKDLAKALDQAEHFAKEADNSLAKLTGGDGDTSAYYALVSIAHIRCALAEIDRQARAYRKKLQTDLGKMPPWLSNK